MLLSSLLPMPPLLPPSSPALPRLLLLMRSCLLRCVQLMALPQWLVGRFRPLCTNVLAAARRASCLRGLAGGLTAFGLLLLDFFVEDWSTSQVRPRELEPIATRAAALPQTADGEPARAHLAQFSLTPAEVAGAFDKVDFRVRDFGGVFVFAVMARVHVWTWAPHVSI